jgi:AsmA protein
MGKTLKVLGWLVGMLLVLIIAAIVLVPMFVDLNDHKKRIIYEVRKATGRDLGITGEIGLSVFPRFALELNGLSLSNAKGFQGGDFAAVKHAEVRVNMIPLLFHQVLEVDTVKVDGLTLNLAKSKTGATNWDDMLGSGKKPVADNELPDSGDSGKGGMLAFSIGGVTIDDAQVVWDDQASGEHYEVANLNLKTGELMPGQSVDVSFSTSLESRKPQLKGTLDLTGRLLFKPEQQIMTLDSLNLKTDVTGEGLPEKGISGLLQADIKFDQAHNVLDVSNLKLSSGKLVLSGEILGQDLQQNPKLEGNLRLDRFSPREWMEYFGLPVPATADAHVLESMELTTDFAAGEDQVKLKQLTLKLDQTVVKGNLDVITFSNPMFLFTLNVDQINLDRYLPPPVEASQPAARRSGGAASGNEKLFPVEPLRQIRMNGTLSVDSLTVNRIRAAAVQLKLRARDGKLSVDQQIGRFYDGLQKGSLTLDVSGATPKLQVSQQLSRILAGPLLKDLTGDDKLLGSGDLDLNITSQGDTINQLKRGLNGKLSFDFRDGAVKGFNLAKMIRDARARLRGESVEIVNQPEQTDFSQLNGSATITNGLVNNQQLLAMSPYLRVEGSGKANLIQEDLDYTIRPVIVNTSAGQGGKGLEELKGIPIPVRISGSWSDPKFSIQLAKVLEEQQKAKLKAKLDTKVEKKLQEKVPEDLQDKLKGRLKKLF